MACMAPVDLAVYLHTNLGTLPLTENSGINGISKIKHIHPCNLDLGSSSEDLEHRIESMGTDHF